MSLLLRTVKQNRWHKQTAQPFLEEDDVPSDPLADLNTMGNLLSVWVVDDVRSNIERLVRAVVVGRDHLDHAGYVVFDSKVLDEAGIEIIESPGKSPDQGANGWHRGLVLSGNKMVALAKGILRYGDSGQILKAKMKELIDDGVRQGQLSPEVQKKFAKTK